MKRLSLALIVVAALIPSNPVIEPQPLSIELVNPKPIPDYTARATRQRQRPQLTLQQLPAKWQRLAWCESRQRLHAVNNHTYYGLWQIHKGWYKPFGINPTTATIAQQWQVAQHVYKRQGAAAWTCSKLTNFK